MFFRNVSECEKWAGLLEIDVKNLRKNGPFIETDQGIRIAIENERHRSLVLARRIVSWLDNFDSCLFWVHEYGIWPSAENWHLYYKLRSSYGDQQELRDAPGHFLLEYEKGDLVTLFDLAIRSGWGAHILPSPKWTYLYLSHDGWIHVETEANRDKVLQDIDDLSLARES